mmetsp:Transcript_93783/g.162878  ORF Transcript_93783/g.162878 Transcript_93783/m.162878 type:complete len:84 (+) Transcript_93783:52-303(+)
MGGSGRLNEIGVDPEVREAKLALLPKGIGVAKWIEHRVGEHLSVEPDPVAFNNQIVSIVGDLSEEPQEPQAKRRKVGKQPIEG